jgi:hypothetical protein
MVDKQNIHRFLFHIDWPTWEMLNALARRYDAPRANTLRHLIRAEYQRLSKDVQRGDRADEFPCQQFVIDDNRVYP